MIKQSIQNRLLVQNESGLKRLLRPVQRDANARISIDGQRLINFSSNDYLGISFESVIKDAFCEGIKRYGVGAGGALVVCGYDDEKAKLESAFSDFIGADSSLLFGSGYTANLSVVSALCDNKTSIFIDKYSHASIYDALALKQLSFKRYPHNDMAALESLLNGSKASSKLIISEGVFSMTGTRAPLEQLVALKRQYNASLMIDDAHAIGVLGEKGQGSSSGYAENDIDIVVCPLSKAFASHGAMVSGSELIKDALIQFSRPLLYSTALPKSHAFGLQTTLSLIKSADDRRSQLIALVAYFKKKMGALPYHCVLSDTPIQLLYLGDNEKACKLSEALKTFGYYCYPMRSPTVPKMYTGLRIVLSTGLSFKDIDGFCEALGQAYDLLY